MLPQCSSLPEDYENRNLICYIFQCSCSNHIGKGWANLFTFDINKEEAILKYSMEIEDANIFFKDPPKFIKNQTKAVIFEWENFIEKDGSTNFKLQQKISQQLFDLKIPFRITKSDILYSMSAIILAKIEVQIGDTIIFICVEAEKLKIIEFSLNENGLLKIDEIRNLIKINESSSNNFNSEKSKILGLNNPKKIIATKVDSTANATMKLVRATFKSKKFIELIGMKMEDVPFKGLIKFIENIYDSNETKFQFIPLILNNYAVSTKDGGIKESDEENILIKIKENETLPFTKSCVVSKIQNEFNVLILNKKSKIYKSDYDHKIIVPNDFCHKIKLTLTIDIHNFVTLSHEAVIIPEIEKMLAKLNEATQTSKIPIIGFFNNSSIICVWNENEKVYNFLKSWNGMYGKNLILSFKDEKPKIIDTLPKSRLSIVYDIIKIMSMEPSNIKVDPNWEFKVTNTEEKNPILLQFQYFDKTTKSSSLPFLMALILKNHIKAIKKENGKKPNELGFCIFENKNFDYEQIKRIQEGITKACKLLDISASFCKI